MFTSLGAARQRRPGQRKLRPNVLRMAILAPSTDARAALFNRVLRVSTVLLALVCAALMAAAVLLN
ncbi:hypothetical protein FOJ82_04725 [Tessaracoccus rhinocerotis]|uniref:Uncharacterized protein n=1 Tax=Tessaracoccus rhinocerotis TaxID=1689449 RepID=A0A553K642_9ACTN|nr:hypothetical protein [Tessaracoccus rhinocerotis]TRY20169.1 hypothetical protein FOJ82_04725 [Tessaracoccus rhinocerotis]